MAATRRPDELPKTQSIYKYTQRRPAEVEANPGALDEYDKWRQSTDLREPYRIPIDFLKGTKPFAGLNMAEVPLLCFINSKSGGQAGPTVTQRLSQAISYSQVFDVSQHRPDVVLQAVFDNLRAGIRANDPGARHIATHLCILCCGGDGTVAWVLKTIRDLELDPPPHVAICPLGTGNDLSLSMGWGGEFKKKWFDGYKNLYKTLARISNAKRIRIDCWRATLSAADAACFDRLPHSMEPSPDGTSVHAPWWNYLSMGIDAESAWGFAHLRETRPHLARTRGQNMAWYAWYSCASGWFCPGSYALQDRVVVQLQAENEAGELEQVKVSHGIGAVVLLNLQSYGGGRDLWGLSNDEADHHTKKTFKEPIFNDGLFEVVGLRSGWHTALVMGKFNRHIHATRLAQTRRVVLTASAAGPGDAQTYMQMDGEPWPQTVPGRDKEPLRLEVVHDCQSAMLLNADHALGTRSVRKLVARGALLAKAVPQQRPKAFAVELLKSGRHGSAKVEEEASSSFTADEDNPYSTGGEANGGAEGRGARGGPP